MDKTVLTPKVKRLVRYVQGLLQQENGRKLYETYKKEIESVTPQEVFTIFHQQLVKGFNVEEILVVLDKVINVFYNSLVNYQWEKPAASSFLDYLRGENEALLVRLNSIKKIIKNEKDLSVKQAALLPQIIELQKFKHHYEKKENILFPLLENKMEKFSGLTIMWGLHEKIKEQLRLLITYLKSKQCREDKLNEMVGKMIFAMHGLVKKEELILFPVASESLTEEEWLQMHIQSLEYKFPFINKPQDAQDNYAEEKRIKDNFFSDGLLHTETGVLEPEQILMILNTLPLDLTFVDENNKVRFFTKPEDRIFPRSPAIIGRDVEKCHPPQSIDTVEKIINAFRAGKQNHATFWLEAQGKKILIQYFALRDSSGQYRGVLELSQDITEITNIKGERRLLHWE
ncbi:MAG: DUF438 domain-containing protein [Firmicutes bacterium]|nr:DUF438 domain-containing protein [Bacillota bacterium]